MAVGSVTGICDFPLSSFSSSSITFFSLDASARIFEFCSVQRPFSRRALNAPPVSFLVHDRILDRLLVRKESRYRFIIYGDSHLKECPPELLS